MASEEDFKTETTATKKVTFLIELELEPNENMAQADEATLFVNRLLKPIEGEEVHNKLIETYKPKVDYSSIKVV